MKYGFRKPSIKKSLKARTTGRIKRTIKSSINPIYGKKGVGFVKNPEKSVKNSIYHKVTFDATKPIKDKINNTNLLKNNKDKTNKEERNTFKMSGKTVAGIIGGITGIAIIGAGLSGGGENVIDNVATSNDINTSYVSEVNVTNTSIENEVQNIITNNTVENKVTTQPTSNTTSNISPSPSAVQPATVTKDESSVVQETKKEWVLNTNTKKFHYPYCKSVKQMKDSNKKVVTDTRDNIIKQGYSPCGNCDP